MSALPALMKQTNSTRYSQIRPKTEFTASIARLIANKAFMGFSSSELRHLWAQSLHGSQNSTSIAAKARPAMPA